MPTLFKTIIFSLVIKKKKNYVREDGVGGSDSFLAVFLMRLREEIE